MKILIAEDEPAVRELISITLQESGSDFIYAGGGPEAVETALRERPDLIFMDVNLPGFDGIEAISRIKATPERANTHVVVVTGIADHWTEEEARKAGAKIFLVKPFNPQLLLDIVNFVES